MPDLHITTTNPHAAAAQRAFPALLTQYGFQASQIAVISSADGLQFTATDAILEWIAQRLIDLGIVGTCSFTIASGHFTVSVTGPGQATIARG